MATFNSSKKEKVLIEEEQEDVALIAAIKEGLQSGIATEQEKNDFESFLLILGKPH